jgi:hypothetical protein
MFFRGRSFRSDISACLNSAAAPEDTLLLFGPLGIDRRHILCQAVQFPPYQVGRKSGSDQRTVKRSQFFLIDFSTKQPKLSLYPLPNNRGWIGFRGGIFQCSFNVTVGNPPRPQLACDAVRPLLPCCRPVPRKLSRVSRVIDQVFPLQALHNGLDDRFIRAPPREYSLDFGHGMGAPH